MGPSNFHYAQTLCFAMHTLKFKRRQFGRETFKLAIANAEKKIV